MEDVLPGREANDLPWGKKVFPGGSEVGETIQINYKMNLIEDKCQRFSLTL